MLTVEALNVSLSDVLNAVRNKTGIEFEGIDRASEPVAVVIGPAPEGEAIAAILAGSRFDFIIIGRPDSPGVIQRVILSPKGAPAAIAARTPQPKAAEPDDDNSDDQATEEPQDTAMAPPAAPTATPPQQAPKTPEQLMEEIRKMKGSPPGDAQSNQAPRKPPR
jgi:hypothetical protein